MDRSGSLPEMSLVASIEAKISKLKAEIKEWEHSFSAEHEGAKPTHEDVKSDGDVQYKYKKYNKYKKQLKDVQEKENLKTPTKQAQRELMTPQSKKKDGRPQSAKPSPFNVKEIGPTPQLQGRVLSIFDIPVQGSQPAAAGVDEEVVSDDGARTEPVFKTPSKTKPGMVNLKRTPTTSRTAIAETPVYLRAGSFASSQLSPGSGNGDRTPVNQRTQPLSLSAPEFNVEPSPMISPERRKVKRKSLFQMMTEVEQIQSEVGEFKEMEAELEIQVKQQDDADQDEDAQEAQKIIDQENGSAADVDADKSFIKRRKAAKTQKRSTKRRKMRPAQLDEEDELLGVNIHEKMASIRNPGATQADSDDDSNDDALHNERILNQLDDDDEMSSYESGSESESEPEAAAGPAAEANNGQEKFKLLNKNFVRMKIHYKKNNFFKKRR